MHRSNPLAFASGLLFLAGLGLLWYVFHDFPFVSKLYLGIAYCAAASLIGFWMWQHGQRLARIIEDIPTSRIASAPQGYVELLGEACEIDDMSLVSGISGTPCLWYRWQIARRGGRGHGNDLVTSLIAQTLYIPDEHEESQSSIGIQDSTGAAVIFPHGSEIIAAHRQTWHEGDARFTEERIMPGDSLYVLGDFSTHIPSERPWDGVNEVASQLSIWQADKPSLLRRFDRNGNSVLDPDEWEMMHREAMRSAKQKQVKELAAPIVHRVMAPDNGYHFLISSEPPQKLASHYRFWRTFGLGLFLGMGALGLWLGGLRLAI